MDYYATLGLQRGASPDEIKKAYRSMAMKHHPDRGGDEKKFKDISAAYEILSDPQKKQMYDMGVDPNHQAQSGFYNQGPFEFHFNSNNFEDIFSNFGFGNFGHRQMQRNKTISLIVDLFLEDVLNGKTLDAEVTIPGGRKKIINIVIPPGIEDGQQVRYQGMGDNSITTIPPGDLIVNVRVRPHRNFRREGDNLIIDKIISVWDAILGCKIEIQTLDNKNLEITVPAGSQPDTVLSCRNEGLPNMRTKQKGQLLIRVKIQIPKNLNKQQLDIVNQLKHDGL